MKQQLDTVRVELDNKKIVIESYETTLQGDIREREHSNKIILDLRY